MVCDVEEAKLLKSETLDLCNTEVLLIELAKFPSKEDDVLEFAVMPLAVEGKLLNCEDVVLCPAIMPDMELIKLPIKLDCERDFTPCLLIDETILPKSDDGEPVNTAFLVKELDNMLKSDVVVLVKTVCLESEFIKLLKSDVTEPVLATDFILKVTIQPPQLEAVANVVLTEIAVVAESCL